jgi:hypothetical protein
LAINHYQPLRSFFRRIRHTLAICAENRGPDTIVFLAWLAINHHYQPLRSFLRRIRHTLAIRAENRGPDTVVFRGAWLAINHYQPLRSFFRRIRHTLAICAEKRGPDTVVFRGAWLAINHYQPLRSLLRRIRHTLAICAENKGPFENAVVCRTWLAINGNPVVAYRSDDQADATTIDCLAAYNINNIGGQFSKFLDIGVLCTAHHQSGRY